MSDEEKDEDDPPFFIYFLTEFFGTAILMWVGCMGCTLSFGIGPVIPAFAFGFAVMSSIQIFGHISPIHINPAVSVGVLVLGKIKPIKFLIYLVAQYLGAIAGYGLLQILMPDELQKVCILHIEIFGVSAAMAFGIEFGATMVLMFAVASTATKKTEQYKDSLALRLGMVIAGLVFAAAPFTGAGLNPARAFAPALLNNRWKDHWLYELGPICGMALAAVLYRFVFNGEEKNSLHSYLRQKCGWCIVS